jgi:hypothetical protein
MTSLSKESSGSRKPSISAVASSLQPCLSNVLLLTSNRLPRLLHFGHFVKIIRILRVPRLSGSNYEQAMDIIERLGCKEVYAYAMGQEPWLNHVMSLKYTEQSRPIIDSIA